MMLSAPTGRAILREDRKKIEESILYLLSKRDRLTQFQIGKALYFADLEHLRRFGRPVTFDNYAAMRKGPVPSLAYDALKPSKPYKELMGSDRPWTCSPKGSNPEANEFTAKKLPDLQILSGSDIDALEYGLKIVLETPPEEFERMTHDNAAYKEAWEGRALGKKSKMMLLSLMIGRNGDDRAEQLAYMSRL